MYTEVHSCGIADLALSAAIPDLLAMFEAGRASTVPPSYEAFGPRALAACGDRLMVLRPCDPDDYVYEHYGRAIARYSRFDMSGRRMSEFSSEVTPFFRGCYDRARREHVPLYTVHRSTHATAVDLWERLILPTRDQRGDDVVVVFSAPRAFRRDLLTAVFEGTPHGILAFRAERNDAGHVVDAVLVAANRRAGRILGTEIAAQARLRALVPDCAEPDLWRRLLRVVLARLPDRFETTTAADGPRRWLRHHVAPLGDGLVMTIEDITDLVSAQWALDDRNRELTEALRDADRTALALAAEVERREALERELTRLATTDPLTRLLNRRAFDDLAERALSTAARYRHPLSLVCFDIDHFKKVNDRYGHAGGDAVLVAVADLLEAETRRGVDVVARIGGEEFVIVMPQTDIAGGTRFAERLRHRLETTAVAHGSRDILVTASFGVAGWREGEGHADTLTRADEALYRAKQNGRNAVLSESDWPGRCATCVLPTCSVAASVCGRAASLAHGVDLAGDAGASLVPQHPDDVPVDDRSCPHRRHESAVAASAHVVVPIGGADDERRPDHHAHQEPHRRTPS